MEEIPESVIIKQQELIDTIADFIGLYVKAEKDDADACRTLKIDIVIFLEDLEGVIDEYKNQPKELYLEDVIREMESEITSSDYDHYGY